MKLSNIHREIASHADKKKALVLQRFFKTGIGQYGHGDIFLGITVPQSRKIAARYKDADETCIVSLLTSKIHEERLIALLILIAQFERGEEAVRKRIYTLYLKYVDRVNNWDLVDLSADKIVGAYLYSHPEKKQLLEKFVRSNNMWERRIAIITTFHFIKKGSSQETVTIAKILLGDPHDLIHKAVGWMLREVGKRVSINKEKQFLETYAARMPRTMLRYAIERMTPGERRYFLAK